MKGARFKSKKLNSTTQTSFNNPEQQDKALANGTFGDHHEL